MMLKDCFDRNAHDLLHTSTPCHFKICLKSHTTGTLARRDPTAAFLDIVGPLFYSTSLCRRWNEGSLYNRLKFSEEALIIISRIDGKLKQTNNLMLLVSI